jgi:hypothetical protein
MRILSARSETTATSVWDVIDGEDRNYDPKKGWHDIGASLSGYHLATTTGRRFLRVTTVWSEFNTTWVQRALGGGQGRIPPVSHALALLWETSETKQFVGDVFPSALLSAPPDVGPRKGECTTATLVWEVGRPVRVYG